MSKLLRVAAVVALVLSLPTVTAGAAVRGNGNGNGNGHHKDKGNGNGNGSAPAQTPVIPAAPPVVPAPAPPVPPGQAKKEQAAATKTAPGQAKKNPATSGDTTPGQSGGSAAPVPAAPLIPVAAPAPPVLGKSMAVAPVDGRVLVRLPSSGGYVSLADAGSVPNGSVVDARRGTLTLKTALDAIGHVQTAKVRGAVFEVRQSATGNGMTDLVLRGGRPASCAPAGSSAAGRVAAVSTKKAKPGALWTRDSNGRFRTRGRNSVATVRGTRWSTRETCAGTVTRVMQGAVDVRDLRTGRIVRVRAGHAYLARGAR